MDTARTDAVILRTQEILDSFALETDRERVLTLISNFHTDPSTVTPQVVRAAIHRVNRTLCNS